MPLHCGRMSGDASAEDEDKLTGVWAEPDEEDVPEPQAKKMPRKRKEQSPRIRNKSVTSAVSE